MPTAAGEARPPRASFVHPLSTYSRAATPVGEVYVTNKTGQPCLVATDVATAPPRDPLRRWMPPGPDVRNWLLSCYASILQLGAKIRPRHTILRMLRSQVYDLVPVAPRIERNAAGTAGRISCQVTLTRHGRLGAGRGDRRTLGIARGPAGLSWTKVRLPATVQFALFCAGKTPNPWFADNYKQLQSLHHKDWYLRRTFHMPDDWAGLAVRLRFDGLDYSAVVWLDGHVLGRHEGMAGGPTFDLTGRLKPGHDHTLLVRLIHEQGVQDMPSRPPRVT